MDTMKKVRGLDSAAPEYGAETQALLLAALARQRTVFIPTEDQYRGSRFGDDQKTSWAIRGTYQEEEVRTNPDVAARAGLEWAAGTDYYYQFDKEWD